MSLPLAANDQCKAAEPSAVRNNWINFNHIVCTGGHVGADSCGGDSGSPVVITHEGVQYIAGVLTKGTENPSNTWDCGVEGRYGVYTKVLIAPE